MSLLLLLLWVTLAHADISPPMAPWPSQAPQTDLAAPTGPAPQTPWLPILLGLGGVVVVGGAVAATVRRRQTIRAPSA